MRSRSRKKSLNGHATVVGGHATDVMKFKIFWKKSLNGQETVVGSHATVGRLSNNVFCDVSSNSEKFFEKKSLNGHATVVGGHATVGRLSNNVFLTFQAIRNFEKSHWTVTRQWSEVTRPSADCQTTFFRRFKQFGNFFLKKSLKVTRQWSEVTRPLDDCQTTFFDVSSNSEKFWKKSLKVTRQWSEVTRPLDDCQTTFFRRFKQFGKILKKVTEGHATVVGGHATVGWLSNNVF